MSSSKLVVGYVRCSTEMQEDSPEQQQKEILRFAEQKGFKIVEWYIDFGKTGTNFDQRPEFQRLRKRVESKPDFEVVICYDESRWGRAAGEENGYWRHHFKRFGIKVLLVKTSVDPSNDFAPMLSAFEGVQSAQYSKNLSMVTLRGALNNGIYSNGGTAPYGFLRIAVNLKSGDRVLRDGEWCVSGQEKVKWGLGEEKEIRVVKEIFQKRASGMACILIAESLNRRKVPCPKRGRWKNKDRKWSQVTIKTIIENPAYYGARVYNRNSMSKIQADKKGLESKTGFRYPHWRNSPDEWTVVENAHEPIVDKKLWEDANAVNRQKSGKRNQFTYKSSYLLSGLIICPICGFAYQGNTRHAKGHSYHHYVDGGWQNKRVCSHFAVQRDPLEQFAIKSIKEVLCDPYLAKRLETAWKQLLANRPAKSDSDLKTVEQDLELCEKKIEKHTEAIEAGGNLTSILNRLKALETEKEELKIKLSKLQTVHTVLPDVSEVSRQVSAFLLKFEDRFERADIQERKLLVRKMISQITIDRERKVARFYVRRLPAVTPQLEALYENKRALTEVVSAQSSGGRT